MDAILTKLINLPTTIGGYTIKDKNGDYNIYLNSRLSYERQVNTYKHELKHIKNGDFNTVGRTDLIEIHAHEEG